MSRQSGKRGNDQASKRPYVKQSDVPSASLNDALRVPQAILDHYAGNPTPPLKVAKALNMDPNGSQIRALSGAAIAFGLIEGGSQASVIGITDLAKRILRPKEENEEFSAKQEAVLKPRVFGDFLSRYDGHPFPRKDIALNVVEDMGVPREKAEDVLERILTSAQSVGFIEEIKGKSYVTLQGAHTVQAVDGSVPIDQSIQSNHLSASIDTSPVMQPQQSSNITPLVGTSEAVHQTPVPDDQRRRRVFITHGKNRDLVDPIKRLLEYGELEAVISVERQSVSKPVPEKVMDDMRSSGAAIIHVDADNTVIDKDGSEHVILNPNVLIEIGAAMAFYGRRFILLVRDSVKLPSNLQGLYEVRYSGSTLDANSTIKLLEAIKDIKNHPLPTGGTAS